MDRLTRERIEALHKSIMDRYLTSTVNVYPQAVEDLIAYRDLALQSLSQEAVRDEVLVSEFSYLVDGKPHRICDCDAYRGPCKHGLERTMLTAGLSRCLIPETAALKREPNAAGPDHESPKDALCAEPAPAAPDVASMVKRLRTVAEMREPRIAHIIKIADEAAALLAKLGQDTSVLMDAVRRYGATMTNDEILAQIPGASDD